MTSCFSSLQQMFLHLQTNTLPTAMAQIVGNEENPQLMGNAYFYQVPIGGVLIEVEVCGLPPQPATKNGFYGMHIHETGNCTPPFDKTGNHYNPTGQPHPLHGGDLPSLLGNDGYAYSVFYTQRFQLPDILNRSLIIHAMPDDFTTQPSGNSGEKIGCGIITEVQRNAFPLY